MTNTVPDERANSLALHLGEVRPAKGLPAFITPRLRQMHQQQARHDNPKFARAVLPSRKAV